LFWARLSNSELAIVNRIPVFKTQIPELNEGTWIIVINKEHVKYMEPARVTKRDHKHYRVEFNDGSLLWVPQHWVEKIPWN
jgi:hypothetical protein